MREAVGRVVLVKPRRVVSNVRSSDTPITGKGRVSAALRSDSFGAGNRTRTGDINLGKVALYQLSYARERRRRAVSVWGAVKLAPLSRPLTAGARFLFLRTLHADAVRVQFAVEVG